LGNRYSSVKVIRAHAWQTAKETYEK